MNNYETLIKLDIDQKTNERIQHTINKRLIKVAKELKKYDYNINRAVINVFETRKGYHFYIKLFTDFRLKPEWVLFIQTYLGSDLERELFNFGRIVGKKQGWNVLFKSKFENGKKSSFEIPFFSTVLVFRHFIEEEKTYK